MTTTQTPLQTGTELNIGDTLAFLYSSKKAISALNKHKKDLEEEMKEAEDRLIRLLKEQKLDGTHANGYSATISEVSYGSIEDFDAFADYIKETDSFFLLQRRLSQAAYNDLKQANEEIPGIKDFTKTSLSLRKR